MLGPRNVFRTSSLGQSALTLAALFSIIAGLTYAFLSVAIPATPVVMHVRWKTDVAPGQRAELERRFTLTKGELDGGTTWRYSLVDASTNNIRALIQHDAVDDTAHLNRVRYRPEFAQDRTRRLAVYAAATGMTGSVALLLFAAFRRRVVPDGTAIPPPVQEALFLTTTPTAHDLNITSAPVVNGSIRAGATTLLGGLVALAMSVLADAPFGPALAAIACVCLCGYVVGALLVPRVDSALGLSLAIVRTVAGLLLTTVGFLLSLVLSLPWLTVPVLLVAAAVVIRRGDAFVPPHLTWRFTWDGLAAGVLALAILSPVWISVAYMAPGPFPPVFYNIDTAHTLEKVHALVRTDSYPPPSLSNVGIHRSYHYGSQAMAAFLSRSSGLPPHQSLFMVVLPLLTLGLLASANAAARYLCPIVPRSVAVPLLLVSTPSLSRSFWHTFGMDIGSAFTSEGLSLETFLGNTGLWGVLSNESMNVGGDFMIVGSIAAIAAAPVWGWALAAFLIGTAMIVKTTVGVALVAGFGLAEAWRLLTATRLWPSRQALMAAGVFIVTFVAFFVVSFESIFHLEIDPLYHLRQIVGTGMMTGSTLDLLWLCLPALIVLTAGTTEPGRHAAFFLPMSLAPLMLVNVTRLDNTGVGGGGSGDDWLQILHAVPFLLHAFALSVASTRWPRLGRVRRTAFLGVAAATVLSVALAAGYYSATIVRDPQRGTDFVDNRSLAGALSVVPTDGTVLVTNDLRYPAGNFTRDDRQMQIPALYGHQAFAVNYAYEPVEDRRGLQQLLQQPHWSDEILEAARAHHWTHLVVRKDYPHADRIPLERIFENEEYEVFVFP